MNRLSPAILILGTFFLALIGGFWGAVMPQIRKASGEEARIRSLTAQKSGLERDAAKRRAAEERVREVQDLAVNLLPAEDKQFDLAVQVEATAKTSGVILTSLALNPNDTGQKTSATTAKEAAAQKELGALKRVSLSLTVSGSYENIQAFAKNLVRLERFVQIDQLNLSAASVSTSTPGTAPTGGQLSAQITAFAYYLPEPTPTPEVKK